MIKLLLLAAVVAASPSPMPTDRSDYPIPWCRYDALGNRINPPKPEVIVTPGPGFCVPSPPPLPTPQP
jgi:hypothetical protein